MLRIVRALTLLAVMAVLFVSNSMLVAAAPASGTAAWGVLGTREPASTPAVEDVGILGECNYSGTHPTLVWGSTGEAVVHAQCLMRNLWNYNISVDGVFGPQTHETVLSIQDRAGIVIDGIIGSCTWKALHKDPIPSSCRR